MLLVLLIVGITLTGCTESVKSFNSIKKDDTILEFLQENYGVTEITNIALEKRQTNKEKKQDLVYCNITSKNDTDELNGTFLLSYNYYEKGGWILDSVTSKNATWKPLLRIEKDEALNLLCDYLQNHSPTTIYYKLNVFELAEQISTDFSEHFIITGTHDGKYITTVEYYNVFWDYDTEKGKWNFLYKVNGWEYFYPTSYECILKTENIIGNYILEQKKGNASLEIIDITDEYMDVEASGIPTYGWFDNTFQTNGVTRIYLDDYKTGPGYKYYELRSSSYIKITSNDVCLNDKPFIKQ